MIRNDDRRWKDVIIASTVSSGRNFGRQKLWQKNLARQQNMENVTLRLKTRLEACDACWQQRKRKINTASIFAALCDSASRKRGLDHILTESRSDFTAQALGRARTKLPEHIFDSINKSLQVTSEPRVFAIDGSKVHIHPSFVKAGYTSRTNDRPVSRPAVRPLAMLSSMFDVSTRTCYDSVITSHFNERESALRHLDATRPGDTLIFDRGYYSNALLRSAHTRGVNVVFRLRCNASRAATNFWKSSNTVRDTVVVHPNGTFTSVRYVKYFIAQRQYMILTNFKLTPQEAKSLYAKRWTVETSFRRLKSDLHLEVAHSMSAALYVQEMEARILLDTVAQQARSCGGDERPGYIRSVDTIVKVLRIMASRHMRGVRPIVFRTLLRRFISNDDLFWCRPPRPRCRRMATDSGGSG